MANFLRHDPCPKCHSRDNLGIYDDGSAWCFGCGYYVRPERTLDNARPKEESKSDAPDGSLADLSNDIPDKPLKWLRSYGITDDEIKAHEIKWCASKDSLTLGRQFRYFGPNPDHPKAVTIPGRKDWTYFLGEWPLTHGPVVFVEDFLSAIKVGRCCAAEPLFGSHIDDKALFGACERFKLVGVWLDADKAKTALQAVLRASAHGYTNVRVVHTPLDPKCYGTGVIRDFLHNAELL